MWVLIQDFDHSEPFYVNTDHITRIEFDVQHELFRLHLSDKAFLQCSYVKRDNGEYYYPGGACNFTAYNILKSLVQRGV